MKYFYSSFVITAIGLLVAFFIGNFAAVYICFLLCVLEISLSFDNAVVNAKVLSTMSTLWQRRFVLWGIPVAVFGMRFLFPVLIVAVAARLGVGETFMLALNDPDRYHEILSEHRDEIYIFGGGFLLMVFSDFFFEDREIHWIKPLESNFLVNFLQKVPNISVIFAVTIGLILTLKTQNYIYTTAYFSAILIYMLISSFNELFSTNGVRSGLMGFLYLETLDASFSFDGVIGAFALSENIFIIMIGLGSGAMFVRSLTIYFVERKTLANFVYLEHGAHYAILCLALIMFAKTSYEVSEIVTGTIGFGLIALSFLASFLHNKKLNRKLTEVIAGNDE